MVHKVALVGTTVSMAQRLLELLRASLHGVMEGLKISGRINGLVGDVKEVARS